MSSIIFHIADEAKWRDAHPIGAYRTDSLVSEGFIHCSVGPQVAVIASFLYSERENLALLAIDTDRLRFPVKFEGETQNVFPHLYGPLNPEAVIAEFRLQPEADGTFKFPPAARRICPYFARLAELLRMADADPLLSGYVNPDDLDLPRLPIWCDTEIVGFATPRQDRDGIWRMGALYIAPDYRGQGLATRAIADFMHQRRGRAFIEFGNIPCRKAFSAAGFHPYRRDEEAGGEWWSNLPRPDTHATTVIPS